MPMQQEDRLNAESGLYPQKMLEVLLSHEVARSKRYPNPISLIYLALRFAETPSEDVMDSARLLVANTLHSKLREVDMPGHFEGNYMVILPSTEEKGARTAAQRLLQQLRGKQVTRSAREYELAICVGVASHLGGPQISTAELLSQCASALWEAQRRGAHSLVLFSELQTSPAT